MAISKITWEAWGWVQLCGLCEQPIPVDLCKRLGHNINSDGHLCETKERAEDVLLAFQKEAPELFDDVVVAKLTIEVS